VIVYLHAGAEPRLPPWLEGFQPPKGVQVCRRETVHGHLVGVGDPLVFDCPPADAFCEVEDGWRAAIVGRVDPLVLARRPAWCRTSAVEDLRGRTWLAPIILDVAGDRDFLVAYGGREFLPRLTPEQEACERVARAAREAIPKGIEIAPAGARWTSLLLTATTAISADTIAELGLVDDALAVGALAFATGLPLRREDARAGAAAAASEG
jgi:hypothetical protein